MRRTVWLKGGCRSWYLDAAGRNSATWPGSVGAFRRRVAPFRAAEYLLNGAAGPAVPGSAPSLRGSGPPVGSTDA
ncbi:MAG: hypothetical protein O9284_01795 [Steroidobacteraceae bacterium]|jgi:hypothetical protein|nr:hypothetical protein [Steroidobacteraceae bacterium]